MISKITYSVLFIHSKWQIIFKTILVIPNGSAVIRRGPRCCLSLMIYEIKALSYLPLPLITRASSPNSSDKGVGEE